MRAAGASTAHRRALWCAAAVLCCLSWAARASATASAAPLYGVTIDRTGHLKNTLAALSALPEHPTARVYFDVHEPASYYTGPVTALDGPSTVMGELLDSSDEKSISVAGFQERVESYLTTLGSKVGIWEIGNEVNGNWTGPYTEVAAKLTEAYEDVAATGAPTALTLFENDFGPQHCGDGESELTPMQFSDQYVPQQVARGLTYVLLSYYPTECGDRMPSSEEVAEEMRRLHSVYPGALLGFGEVGLPRHAGHATIAVAREVMRWAYSLSPDLPYYVGGYFWWYASQDALGPKAPLRSTLSAAFEAEYAALGAGPF